MPLLELIRSAVNRIQTPFKYVMGAGVVAASAWYILSGPRYISVPGNRINFTLPAFQECEITFLEPIRIASYQVTLPQSVDESGNNSSIVQTTNFNAQIKILPIHVNQRLDQQQLMNARFQISIFSTSTLENQIQAISVDGETMKLEDFFRVYLQKGVRAEYVHTRASAIDPFVLVKLQIPRAAGVIVNDCAEPCLLPLISQFNSRLTCSVLAGSGSDVEPEGLKWTV